MPANQPPKLHASNELEYELPELPPLEADEPLDEDMDYADLFGQGGGLLSPEDEEPLDAGPLMLDIQALSSLEDELPSEEDEHLAPLGELLNLPEEEALDEPPDLSIGEFLEIDASRFSDTDDGGYGDAEGPEDRYEFTEASWQSAEEDEEPSSGSELGLFTLDIPEDNGSSWPMQQLHPAACYALSGSASPLSPTHDSSAHAGGLETAPSLLAAGAEIYDLFHTSQAAELPPRAEGGFRDIYWASEGVYAIGRSGLLYSSNGASELTARLRQLEPSRAAQGSAPLALTLNGELYRLENSSWKYISKAPKLSRLARRSFPVLGVGKNTELFRSLDGGLSWAQIESETPLLAWLHTDDLKLHCAGSLIALGCEQRGLLVSTDGGLSFSELPMLNGVTALCSAALSDGSERPRLVLFVGVYDAALNEVQVHQVDPLELSSELILSYHPEDSELDPRIRELYFHIEIGLVAAGGAGVFQLRPPAPRTKGVE